MGVALNKEGRIVKDDGVTWKSIRYPAARRSFACASASSACLSKMSKWLMRSLVKKGRVIVR